MKKLYLFILLPLLFTSQVFSQCFTTVSSKGMHNLAIKTDGTLWAWGKNDEGQIGNGTNTDQLVPLQIGTDNDWWKVSAGTFYSVGLKTDGTLWTWGSNSYGQTGPTSQNIPVMLGTDSDWVTIATGLAFTSAIKEDGTLWMWGYNAYGQLGNGTTVNSNTPAQVGTDNNWIAVSQGSQNVLALKSDGTMWAWGNDSQGALGLGNLSDQWFPTQVGTDSDWVKIYAGYSSGAAIKSNGTLWTWGYNAYGMVGDGTNINKQSPIQIGTDTDWKNVTITTHTMAIKNNGELWAWGRNNYGKIGNGIASGSQFTPVQVGSDTDWILALPGFEHSITLKGNGTLYTWGHNDLGQLGDGTTIDKILPIQIGSTCTEALCSLTTPPLPSINTECSLELEDITVPTIFDSCGNIITATLYNGSFPITQYGTNTIIWQFANNIESILVTQNIIIEDTNAPTPVIESLSVITTSCSITSEQISIPTAIDICTGEIEATTTSSLSFDEQGSYTIIWSYDDGNGNIATQSQQVLIEDNEMPVPILENLPTLSAQCELSENDITYPTALDNCAGVVIATTEDSLEFSDQGTYTINWIYNDGNGNITSQQQSVTIYDTQAPVPTLETLPIISGECSLSSNDITYPTALDNCAGEVIATTEDSLEFSDQGTYTINWIYNDGNGNITSQQQSVTIYDTQAPVPTLETLPVISGECSLSSNDITYPTALDNCAGEVTATTEDSLEFSDQGTYTIIWIYSDGNGNNFTQQQQVVIEDTQAPVPAINTLPDLISECGLTSEEIQTPTAIDDCEGETIATTNSSLNFSEQGNYTILWTFEDSNGNSIDQEQQIIIEDVTSPTVITQDITVDLNGAASITITSEEINNGSYDNCNIESIEININNFTQPGIYEVVLTVYDNAGNESSDIATVTVVDSSLNINDFTKGDISIYPIPARDFITIKKPDDILILSTDFYDMLGKKLFTIEGNIDRIDTSFLSASSYFIIIHTDKGVLKKNLIIK